VSVEHFTVTSLYLLTLLYGVATALFVPTLSSVVPFMVRPPQFTAANALLQSTTSIGIILGPAASGLGIAFSGSQDVLCVNALIYFASAACLVPIQVRAHGSESLFRVVGGGFFGPLLEGLRWVFLSRQTVHVL